MDEEIVLDRGTATIMKLDADEQALMDEIHISTPRMQQPRRPTSGPPPRRFQPKAIPQEEIDAFANPNKQAPPPRHEAQEIDYGEDEPMMYDDDMDEGPGYEQEERPSNGFTSIDEEKADILNKLSRLEKRGFNVNKRLTAYSSIEELRTEVKRVTYSIEVEQSVKFSKRMLIACVTGLEFLNKRYNPFELHLDGWSESVMENQDDYDNVFEELYVKYRTKVNVAPEIKLIMMLGGSAMMFHLTSSMMKAALPNMNDVLKQNPDLMRNMVQAVQSTSANNTQREQSSNDGGQYEMQGPGIDISKLMGGIMMPPPPPMNTTPLNKTREPEPTFEDEDDVSDIVSVSGESTGGEVKEVSVSATTKAKRTRRKKKTEINL
ncbi:hypothetical protein [Dishui Lake phycodnavirus 3]|nr:hypothetical protein [Dishui Lake phycodnavirus 3]